MRSKKGFTLIEVMIVLVIVGLIAFLGVNSLRGTFKSKSRELSWRMASTVKYLFNSAITENKTVRLVFDIENNNYWAESTTDRFLLEKRAEEEKKILKNRPAAGSEEKKAEAGKEEASAASEKEGAEEEPAVEPIEATFGSVEDIVFEARSLPSGVYLKDVWTSHDTVAVESGRAYVYFFSTGYSEPAIINFKDESDERHLSIKTNPFNGTVDVGQEYRKLE